MNKAVVAFAQRLKDNFVGVKDHYIHDVYGVGECLIGPMAEAQCDRIIAENPDRWLKKRCFRESADSFEEWLTKRRRENADK